MRFQTLGWDSEVQRADDQPLPIRRIFPTKAIRVLSFAPATEDPQSQSQGLWNASDPLSSIDARGRSLGQFMDLIAILGGNINGVDGDELVLEGDEATEVHLHYEDEEEILEDDTGEGDVQN